MLLRVSGIRNERRALQRGAEAVVQQDPKGLESRSLPRTWTRKPRRHPGWHRGPPRPLASCLAVTQGFGRTWDISLGGGPGSRLPLPSPELVGLCGSWNPAVVHTCGPRELAGYGQVRVGRERDRGQARGGVEGAYDGNRDRGTR